MPILWTQYQDFFMEGSEDWNIFGHVFVTDAEMLEQAQNSPLGSLKCD